MAELVDATDLKDQKLSLFWETLKVNAFKFRETLNKAILSQTELNVTIRKMQRLDGSYPNVVLLTETH